MVCLLMTFFQFHFFSSLNYLGVVVDDLGQSLAVRQQLGRTAWS